MGYHRYHISSMVFPHEVDYVKAMAGQWWKDRLDHGRGEIRSVGGTTSDWSLRYCTLTLFKIDTTLPCPSGTGPIAPLIEVTVFQLEKIYGKSTEAKAFIQELCKGFLAKTFLRWRYIDLWLFFFIHHDVDLRCDALYLDHWSWGQVGTPHPQAPSNAKTKMFKVLREVPGKKPAVVLGTKHHLLWPR